MVERRIAGLKTRAESSGTQENHTEDDAEENIAEDYIQKPWNRNRRKTGAAETANGGPGRDAGGKRPKTDKKRREASPDAVFLFQGGMVKKIRKRGAAAGILSFVLFSSFCGIMPVGPQGNKF